jgi:predicted nucleic acid-binding protein
MQKKHSQLNIQAEKVLEDLWVEEEKIFVTEYNYAELIRGAYLSIKVGYSLKMIEDLMKRFEIIYSDEDSIHEYAQISANLRLKGELIGDMDQLIASIVIAHKDRLFTHNYNHFIRIPSLNLVDWGNL